MQQGGRCNHGFGRVSLEQGPSIDESVPWSCVNALSMHAKKCKYRSRIEQLDVSRKLQWLASLVIGVITLLRWVASDPPDLQDSSKNQARCPEISELGRAMMVESLLRQLWRRLVRREELEVVDFVTSAATFMFPESWGRLTAI